MGFKQQNSQQRAVYRQIADYIMENILADNLKAGDRMQSVREMATEIGVNNNTVVRTYNFLNKEGIIHSQRNVGYFIVDQAKEKVTAFKKKVFIEEELPHLFKMMDLLQINFEQLQELHKKMYRYENK